MRNLFKRNFLKDESGNAAIQFIIYAGLISFMIFGSIDYWLTQQRISQVEFIKQYYLDRVRLEGCLTIEDESSLVSRLTAAQFNNITINTSAKESMGEPRVLRNSDDLDGSEVYLEIKCEPEPQPFLLAQLIGSPAPGPFTIDVKGRALSERVDP